MASKTAGAAEKMNGGRGKMEDMAEKTEDAAEKTEDVCDKFAPMSQVVAGRRDKRCATFCASGRCANGLKINCLEWQKTRRRPRFLPKNAAKMKKKDRKDRFYK